MTLSVSKYHGLGNDFLVALEVAGLDAASARRLCDRHRGVGADGLVLGARSGGGLAFRLWNADGSEAEMSGNGMRCLAHAALDAGWIAEGEAVPVETPAGTRRVSIRRAADPRTAWATVGMGRARLEGPQEVCNVEHGRLLVDLGNPHLVVLGPDPARVDLARLGPELERADGQRRNVELVALGPASGELTMRVWERGVGETLACGTGACAAAVALHHWGRVGSRVTVNQPGGALEVSIGAQLEVELSGPSERVAGCVVELV